MTKIIWGTLIAIGAALVATNVSIFGIAAWKIALALFGLYLFSLGRPARTGPGADRVRRHGGP